MTLNTRRLKSIDALIRTEATGIPEMFAKKLDVSIATVYRDLKFMKNAGAPIDYNFLKRTYFYKITGSMKIWNKENACICIYRHFFYLIFL